MERVAARGAGARREVQPLLFGTVLFLASETLLFGGLFAAYFSLRARTGTWPPDGVDLDPTIAAVGTAILLISSVTMVAATRAGAEGRVRGLVRGVMATLVLGAAFLAIQLFDYATLDFAVSTHAYGTVYFAMTGLHGLHVLAGVLLMLVVLGRAAQGAYRGGEIAGAEAVAYYWHFVDAVWVALFATLFLLR